MKKIAKRMSWVFLLLLAGNLLFFLYRSLNIWEQPAEDLVEADAAVLVGDWLSEDKVYQLNLSERNDQLILKEGESETSLTLEDYSSKYHAWHFLTADKKTRYRFQYVSANHIIVNFGITDPEAEGVSEPIDYYRVNDQGVSKVV